MDILVKDVVPLLMEFSPVFSQRVFSRFQVLCLAAILTTGRRTVANLLRTMGKLASGHPTTYQRVLSQARWSGLQLACVLTRLVVRRLGPDGVISLVGDDTVDEHRGKKVYGKARHRDAVRSSHSYTAHRYGHKWVVLAVLVQLPFATRPWALPVLVTLYRSPKENQRLGRRHRTPAGLMQQLLRVLLRWFPERRFVFAGDGGYGTHDLASFAQRQAGRLALVSHFYADANLSEPPPPVTGKRKSGRPRVKGRKRPSPKDVVASRQRRQRLTVAWYGGGQRQVEVVSDTSHWYKAGQGLVRVRWVFVHDCTGTHRDEYFFATDVTLTAQQIIETYTGRWNIETTFQEMRAYLGLETTCGWVRNTVLRAAPCLFGLYTVVALLYDQLPARKKVKTQLKWAGKSTTTFSDAITAVRRWLWMDWIFATSGHRSAFAKLPRSLQPLLLYGLAPAA